MSFISEYLDLKKQYKSLYHNVMVLPDGSKRKAVYTARLEETDNSISVLEENEDVKKYHQLKKQIEYLKRKIWSKKRNNQNVESLESDLSKLKSQLLACEEGAETTLASIPTPPTRKKKNKPTKSTKKTEITNIQTKPEVCYYIINLAWSNTDQKILDYTRDFLNESTYIQYHESANMMSWKFVYDTLEEKSLVKALQISAVHLLKIIKELLDKNSDAEIFGKIQNY